jgi:hypothetical protein
MESIGPLMATALWELGLGESTNGLVAGGAAFGSAEQVDPAA